jgi:hypothetical protein
VAREGNRVRLLTRNGHDWSGRYPWIVESALKNRHTQFVIDGEAVILGVDGISDFNGLHSRQQDEDVQLYAFDVLALDGEDLRGLPLSMRKTNLAQLLRGRPDGIFVAPFEQGEIGPDLFTAACNMGLEGLVSKRADRPYRGGRSKDWVKIKNRKHPNAGAADLVGLVEQEPLADRDARDVVRSVRVLPLMIHRRHGPGDHRRPRCCAPTRRAVARRDAFGRAWAACNLSAAACWSSLACNVATSGRSSAPSG